MSSGPVRVMVLAKENAIKDWRTLIGPTNVELARQEVPRSMRAQYGTDTTHNAVHGSDSSESARREIKFFFSNVSLPILEPSEAREYMETHLSTVLRLALTELCKQKPAKPKEWLAQWLLAHNPNKPNLEEQQA